RGVGVDVEVDLDPAEAVADVGIGAEHAEHAHVAGERGGDRPELDAPPLGDGGHPGREAAGEADEDDLRRGRAVVLGGEAEWVVDVVVEGRLVNLLLAQSPEPFHRGAAVGAVDPGARGAPLELSGLGTVGQRLPGVEQRLEVDPVVDGGGDERHRLSFRVGAGWVSGTLRLAEDRPKRFSPAGGWLEARRRNASSWPTSGGKPRWPGRRRGATGRSPGRNDVSGAPVGSRAEDLPTGR